MRVRLNQARLGPAGHYGAASTMALALVTLYNVTPDTILTDYKNARVRFTAFMLECTKATPPDCPSQAKLRELCPTAMRVKLYISEWGMTEPSHYVVLHRVGDVFKLGCARLLKRQADMDSMIEGITITWPSNNPEVAAGQAPTLKRLHMSGASVGVELLDTPELQRELRLSVETAHLYHNQNQVSVWGHPGKTVFEVLPSGTITLIRVRPHAPNVTKPTVILWGDVSSNAVPDATEMSRHIVPQIKGAVPYSPTDATETNMLRWALESRLLPYIAISHTTQRGDIFCLSYDPESDESFVVCVATNHKIVGLPRVLRINNKGTDVYVPDLALAERLKNLFLNQPTHTEQVRRLFRTMGYTAWEHIRLAFDNWGLPLTLEEEDQLEILRAGL